MQGKERCSPDVTETMLVARTTERILHVYQVCDPLRHVPIFFLLKINNHWSFYRKVKQSICKALLLDNNAMIQYARGKEGLQVSIHVNQH